MTHFLYNKNTNKKKKQNKTRRKVQYILSLSNFKLLCFVKCTSDYGKIEKKHEPKKNVNKQHTNTLTSLKFILFEFDSNQNK